MMLHRHLAISYNAAWRMKHKLMQVMMKEITAGNSAVHVQVDDAYWGGQHHGGAGAEALRIRRLSWPQSRPTIDGHPLYMRFNAIDNFRRKTMQEWAEHALKKGTQVVSDGLSCFRGIEDAGSHHTRSLPVVAMHPWKTRCSPGSTPCWVMLKPRWPDLSQAR